MKKNKKKRIFKLTTREKILWQKVNAINSDTLHKQGPNSLELAHIIHGASKKDYIYRFDEKMMSELIIGSYKVNLNLSPNSEYYEKEGVEEFIIQSKALLYVYETKTIHTTYNNLIRKLVELYKEAY